MFLNSIKDYLAEILPRRFLFGRSWKRYILRSLPALIMKLYFIYLKYLIGFFSETSIPVTSQTTKQHNNRVEKASLYT